MPTLVASERSPRCLSGKSAKRSAVAFSPGTKGCSYGGASGPASIEPHSHANEQIVRMLKGRWSSASAANSGPGAVAVRAGKTRTLMTGYKGEFLTITKVTLWAQSQIICT